MERDDSKVYVVYETTNLINGKYYIGVHKQNGTKYLGSGKLLKKAVTKYGRPNFSVFILKTFSNKKSAYAYEEVVVNNTLVNNPNCYNLRVGGYGWDNIDNSGSKHPLYHREVSVETRRKISKNHSDVLGCNNPMYGKQHSTVSKIKMSSTRLGKMWNSNSWVIHGRLFVSSREAAKAFSVNHNTIQYWCNKKVPLCYKVNR